METSGPHRGVLCAYELIRLVFLTGAFLQLQIGGSAPLPLLSLITPGALFFLIALFWLLDMPRYRVYGPLYLVGKGLGVMTALLWIFFTDNYIIRELIVGTERFFASGIVLLLVPGDMFSAWLVMKIMRK
ncbi:MAG: hypothetical protein FWB78_03940 [Treponema sp.]|nr:hypothetical protein [Treponema sp.]